MKDQIEARKVISEMTEAIKRMTEFLDSHYEEHPDVLYKRPAQVSVAERIRMTKELERKFGEQSR